MRCINHTKKIATWLLRLSQLNKQFVELIQDSSLYPLVMRSYPYISSVYILTFIVWWPLEANTFHMPFRKMTISLNDVACVLGLQVTGKSICLPDDLDPQFPVDLLVSSLSVSHSEMRDELNTKGGGLVCLDWHKDCFSNMTNNDSEV